VLSYSVNRRQREMSVRLALGAERRTVMALVLGDGVRLIGLGVVLGGAVALAATRALSPLLFEVSPTEPVVFASAGAAIAVVSLGACWFAARTATRVDPIEALRSDG
jgi:ABC-type antimicrobial peptide transport system permease subunit